MHAFGQETEASNTKSHQIILWVRFLWLEYTNQEKKTIQLLPRFISNKLLGIFKYYMHLYFFFQKLFRSPSAGYPRVADGFLSPLLHGGNSHVICHLQGKIPKPVSVVKSVSHKELCSKIKVSWMIRLNPVSWRGFDVHTNITWSAEIMKSVVFTQLLIRLGYFLRSVTSTESCFND